MAPLWLRIEIGTDAQGDLGTLSGDQQAFAPEDEDSRVPEARDRPGREGSRVASDEGSYGASRGRVVECRPAKMMIFGSEADVRKFLSLVDAGARSLQPSHGLGAEQAAMPRRSGRSRSAPARRAPVILANEATCRRRGEPLKEPRYSTLSPRELEILEQISFGMSNKEIAQRLVLSTSTVKNHIHNILEKLKVDGRYAAVSYAYRKCWLADPTAADGVRRSRRSGRRRRPTSSRRFRGPYRP